MTKRITMFLILSIFLWGCKCGSSGEEGVKSGWKIDRDLKFHLCYFPDKIKMSGKDVAMIDMGNGSKPDITNINLKGLVDLGFPVPQLSNPEKYQFYLKFFNFPESLNQTESFLSISNRYKLKFLENFKALKNFISGSNNLIVKLGVIGGKSDFSGKKNYPMLKDPGKSKQKEFDEKVAFSSLYVKPLTGASVKMDDKEKLAAMSNDGVAKFHKEILNIYSEQLKPLGKTSSEYIFYEKIKSSGSDIFVNVVKLPVNFMELEANYKNLPMPQDPENVFLTGLLLVYSSVYKLDSTLDISEIKSLETITKNGKLIDSRILEVGSVVDFRVK